MRVRFTRRISRIWAGDRVASPLSVFLYETEDETRRSTHPKLERLRVYFSVLSLSLVLSACTSEPHKDAELKTESSEERRASNMGKFLGEDALTFGGPKKREQEDTGLGVNSFLWRASLDTISFMPIASADPFGGVILTDWYSPPQSPQERLKVNIFILDRQLRSDGVKVSIFRQEWDESGQWRDQAVDPKTVKDLVHAILAQARHFRTKATK